MMLDGCRRGMSGDASWRAIVLPLPPSLPRCSSRAFSCAHACVQRA